MRPEFTVRLGTQDPLTFKEVVVENCYKLPGTFEPGDRIIDVGANIGCFTVACILRGAGLVLAVEPHPENFALLKRNTALWAGSIDYRRAALWWKRNEFVSIQDRGAHTAMHCVGTGEQGLGVTAQVMTLDLMLPRPKEGPPIRLLKIDAEGGEYPGLGETTRLRAVKELVVECHAVNLDGQRFDERAVAAVLEGHGFEVTDRHVHEPVGMNVVLWARNRAL